MWTTEQSPPAAETVLATEEVSQEPVSLIQHGLPCTTLAVVFTVGLMAASLWILRPFLPVLIWETLIGVATWPIMLLGAWVR
jgi:hypothetical protein